ncbi:MAG: TerB family tellurite resistance protein, partial [Pirellulales bacterium]|nr:TerB family tellurite resistance protein [Pirellulales bacterium]
SMESLDRLSRFIGKNPEKRETLRAATLLPGEIIMEFGGAPVEQLNEWLREMHQSENGVVSVADLSERATASSSKIITAVHRDIYSLLEALGWSMFPAPQEVVGAIRNDYKVMFVPADQGGRVAETPGANYLLSILKLTLGAYIAHADDAFIAGEKRYLDRLVSDSEGITGREKQRLRQFINWLAVQKIDFSSIKRGIKAADEGDRQVLADMAISVAAADGRIAPQEVRALEDLYSAMGLDRQDLISRLHDLSTRPAKTPEEKTSSGTDAPLDPEKISAILRDTDRASALLENIFQAEEQDVRHESPDDAEESDDAESVLDGLERLHARLLSELMEKDEWTRGEYERLASGLNLMPDGALEVINEWSFGKFDDIMIDDGDLISVNRELVERRRTK